jgi:hypothetical protein
MCPHVYPECIHSVKLKYRYQAKNYCYDHSLATSTKCKLEPYLSLYTPQLRDTTKHTGANNTATGFVVV